MNTIKELTQQEKYNTMLKRKNREIKSLKEQLELLVNDDEKYQETIIRQSKIINKAIEYIDMIQERRKDLSVEEYHNKWCKLFDYYESQCIMLDLLDILKGSDKEC